MVSFSKDNHCSRLFTRLCKNWPGLIDLSFVFLFKAIDQYTSLSFGSKALPYFLPGHSLNQG